MELLKRLFKFLPQAAVQMIGLPISLVRSNPTVKGYVDESVYAGGFTVKSGNRVWFPIMEDGDLTISRLQTVYANNGVYKLYRKDGGEILNQLPSYIEMTYALRTTNVPTYVTGATYVDESEVTQNRTWEEWAGDLMKVSIDVTKVLIPLSFAGSYIPPSQVLQLDDDTDTNPNVTVMLADAGAALLVPGGDYVAANEDI